MYFPLGNRYTLSIERVQRLPHTAGEFFPQKKLGSYMVKRQVSNRIPPRESHVSIPPFE